MTKKLLPIALLLGAFTLADSPWFSGKIVYHNTFKTLAGQDITEKLTPMLGSDDPYYISGNSYKMYTDKKQLLELYTGADNKFRFYMNGQAAPVLDASQGTPGAMVKQLAATATIAGYFCQSLQLTNAADGTSTLYYYAPKLRVDPAQFSKHAFGDFSTYLAASKGALPLRIIVTNAKQSFVMTSEATAVQAMALTAADFTPESPAR